MKAINYFKRNLISLRKGLGFKKRDIAAMMGVEWHTYFYWEDGGSHPNFNQLIQLSEFFGVSIDSLLKQRIK